MRTDIRPTTRLYYRCQWCDHREESMPGEPTRFKWKTIYGWPWCGCQMGRNFEKTIEKRAELATKESDSDTYDWVTPNYIKDK